MIRKFAVALFAVSSLSSSVALALGLGEAKVNSALNQPLEAEIELVSVRDLEAAEILPSLASIEQFHRAGIERHHFLSDLKFQVLFKEADKAVIKVTSSRPVREPFLNFLVEVLWPNGRLLREYALLIDPPLFVEESAQQVQSPQVASVAAPAAMAPALSQPVRQQTTVAGAGANVYGPTSASDTLWKIASRHRPATHVTTQQTMLAIQDLNPDAFIDGNINKLKAGQVLRLPELDDVQRRTPEQAVAEVRLQNRALAEQRGLRERGLDATGARQETVAAQVDRGGDELRILVDEDSGAADGTGKVAGGRGHGEGAGSASLEPQVAIALERLDKAERDNQELRDRLKDLESQLDSLHRLVALKDDQLAVLQGQVVHGAQLTEEIQAQQPTEASAGELVKAVEQAGVTDQPEASVMKTTTTAPEDTSASSEPAAQQAPKKAAVPEPVAPIPQPSFMEKVVSTPLYQTLAGGGVLLILVILWLVSRHKAREEQDFQQRLASVGPDDGEDIVDLGMPPHGDMETSDGVPAGMAEAATDQDNEEVSDVVAEAETYLAYGRVDQAVRLLEEASAQSPQRLDLRLKLLEAYVHGRNVAGFDQQLAELRALGDEQALARAEELRLELQADMPLDEPELSLDDLERQLRDGTAETPQAQESDDANLFQFDTVDDGSGMESPESQIAEDALGDRSAESGLMEETDSLASDNTVSEQPLDESDNLDIEFDISELDLDSLESQLSGEQSGTDEDADVLAALDFESQVSADESQEAEPSPEFDTALDSLEFDASLSEEPLMDSEGTPEPALDVETEFELELDAENLEDQASEPTGEGISLEADTVGDDLEAVQLPEMDVLGESDDVADSEAAEAVLGDMEDAASAVMEEDLLSLDSDAAAVDVEVAADASEQEPAEVDQPLSDEDLVKLSTEALIDSDTELDEEDFDFLSGTDEVATKLDLARAYIDMGDQEGARDILQEVAQEGNEQQRRDAEELLKGLE